MDDITPHVEDAQSHNFCHLIDEIDADKLLMPSDDPDIAELEDEYDAIDEETHTHDSGEGSKVQCAPHVGMEFPTAEDAYNYYNGYSKMKGFCIRKSTTFTPKNSNIVTKRTYVCNKEGHKRLNDKRQDGRDIKRRREEREGCKARIVIQLKDGVWVVRTFDDVHNHDMIFSPKKKAKLRSHNKAHFEPSCKALIEQFHSCGIGPSKISRLVNATSGSVDIDITPRQCKEHLRIKRKNNIGRECLSVIQQFLEKQATDPQFYYAIEIDEEGVCRSIFWADGRARTSYMQFNDVLVFDVTYKTNNFLMPFAPFTGVNHHMQSTLFECALLADEREETFVWLFEQWLKCMWGKAPMAIITDQDPAICNAISRVFPDARHRYCIWHIRLHEDEHLRSLRCAYNPSFDEDYIKWSRKSRNIEESESYWKSMQEKYKKSYEDPMTEKQKNEVKAWRWLQNMYEQRHRWVKAYLKDTFFAGMKSSQRSESMNAYFDGFVNSMTPLHEFVQQYDKALKSRRDMEEEEDLMTMRTKPNFSDMVEIEAHAGRVYTRRVFSIFQKRFKNIIRCWHKKVSKEDGIAIYDVYYSSKDKESMYTVTCNTSLEIFICTCAKFETTGLLCKHILYIMKQKLFMKSIPERYLLARWTLGARHTSVSLGSGLVETNNEANRDKLTPMEAWILRASLDRIYEKVSCHRDLYEVTKAGVENLWKQYDVIEEARDIPFNNLSSQVGSSVPISQEMTSTYITIRDPIKSKHKERPPVASRIPSGKQIAVAQAQARTRTCSACGGKGHDMRTCKAKESRAREETG